MSQSWEAWKDIEPDEPQEIRIVEVAPAVGEVAIQKESFWEDGVEPSWFRFTD